MESYSVEAYLKATGADQFARGFKQATQQVEGLKKKTGGAGLTLKKLATSIGVVALAAKGFRMIKNSIQGAFQRIDTFEQFNRTMGIMVGDTKKVSTALDNMDDYVTGTAYTLDGAAKSVQGFVTRGMDIDKATNHFATWGDAVARYGDGSQEQLDGVTQAMQNMLTKGTVTMDQMRTLNLAGIPAVEMYAEAFGMQADEVQAALSKGEISAEQFIDGVTKAMEEGTDSFKSVTGAAKEEGSTWGAVFSNMQTRAAAGMQKIIEAIDEALTSNGLPDMRAMFEAFGDTVKEVMVWVADNIPNAVEKIKEFSSFVATNFGPLIDTFKGSFEKLKESLGPLWEALQQLFETLKPLATIIGGAIVVALGILIAAFNGAVAAIGPFVTAIINAIDFVINIFNAVIALLTGDFSAAWDYWNKAGQSAVDFFVNLWEGIVNFVSTFVDTIVDFFQGLYMTLVGNSIIPDMVNAIIDWIANMGKWAKDKVKEMIVNVVKFFVEMHLKALQKARDMVQGVRDKFQQIKQTIQEKIQNAKTALITKFQEMVSNARTKVQNILTTVRTTFQNMVSAVRDKINNVRDRVKEGINRALDIVRNIKDKFLKAGKNIVTSIADGIKSAVGKVTGAISDVVSKVRDYLPFSPAKEGPLRDIHRLNFGGPIAQSIQRAMPKVQGMMAELLAIPDMDIAGQVNSINRQANMQMQSHVTSELRVSKQPAHINLYMGNMDFDAYVEDITDVQERHVQLKRAFT